MDKKTEWAHRVAKAKAKGQCQKCLKQAQPLRILCSSCAEKNKENCRKHLAKTKAAGLCWRCRKIPAVHNSTSCVACKEKARTEYQVLKDDVYRAYGGYRCVCCGETTPEFLSLDHVANDGAKHRKEIGDGDKTYRWAKKNGFPPVLQVLCMNCQWGKQKCGICPHKKQGG